MLAIEPEYLLGTTQPWSRWHRASFRFFALFAILMSSPWELIPFLARVTYSWHYALAYWIRTNLLGASVHYHSPTGSGDTLDDWLRCFVCIALALVGSVVWGVLDRSRPNYTKLERALKTVLRLFLGVVLLGYGFSKIFTEQMPEPRLPQLYGPLGQLTPMRLAWLYIGYSKPYEIFLGLGEALGATLLLFRRTTELGAVLLVVVLANVVMVNFCYDIPVKLYSSFYLLLSFYLGWPALKRLILETLFHRNLGRIETEAPTPFKWRMAWALVALILVCFYGLYPALRGKSWPGDLSGKHPLYFGGYNVSDFRDSRNVTARWDQIVIGEGGPSRGYSSVIRRDGRRYEPAQTIVEPQGLSISLPKTYEKYFFQVKRIDSSILHLTSEDSTITMTLTKDEPSFPLAEHPFHWVSPTPY